MVTQGSRHIRQVVGSSPSAIFLIGTSYYKFKYTLGRWPRLDNANHVGTGTQRGRRDGRIADRRGARHGILPSRILLESNGGTEAIIHPGSRQKPRGRVGVLEKQNGERLVGVANLLLPNLGPQKAARRIPARIGRYNRQRSGAARTGSQKRIGGLLRHKGLLRRSHNQVRITRGQIARILECV